MSKRNVHRRGTAVLLHNVRSAHNVGSIFRTAEAAGVSEMWLTGYTPTPTDRFGRARPDIAKAALDAERLVSWRHRRRVADALSVLRRAGWRLVAVEQAPNAADYRKLRVTASTCFVFGNEVRGLSPRVLKQCDAVVEIPMQGHKESLNVSVAAGIILFNTNRIE